MIGQMGHVLVTLAVLGFVGILAMFVKCYHKVEQGSALIRNGVRGTRVSFGGMLVFPVIHRYELMDISVKRIEIDRMNIDGLVCKDNMRADVKVAFFVRVNKTPDDVLKVAQSLGCRRASDSVALVSFFDAKFSEALKTVGKKFDFVELYTNRVQFKEEILKVIGTDLNGYILDDAAIDYLEQTKVDRLDPGNILDAEGIKKITDLTAQQAVLSNSINREKEKIIKKQDVEAREAILMLERQQVDAEQKQLREIAEVTSREQAESRKVQEAERLKSETARLSADEEIGVAEQNKDRMIVVARKNKERVEAVENERVIKDRDLEITERERIVTLAQIEKDKAVEVEKRAIQEVIRERVAVERTVVEEEERIKDAREFAQAERSKKVAMTQASEVAEQVMIRETREAEARKEATRHRSEERIIEADAERAASERQAEARKILADAKAEEEAVVGIGEARALEARARATGLFGAAEAEVIEKKAAAEAAGIRDKADAMKLFDGPGKEHEEFKLELNKEIKLELARFDVSRDVAREQAAMLGEALKSAKIDIVGGDTTFFDKIVNAISTGKSLDRLVDNSRTLSTARDTFLGGDPEQFREQLQRFVGQFGLKSEDVKNLTLAALLAKLATQASDPDQCSILERLRETVDSLGWSRRKAGTVLNPKA